ncbi:MULTISPECIES: hypothetical protein [Microvirga]|uniref:hypothetical protein n=1 Tax=Microvirga TaxID=186650 RepID=UPI0021C8A5AD|nr:MULTISPECIES: hypothetical protein [unclassified Microvirga]
MKKLLTLTVVVLGTATLSACADRTQLPNYALYVQAGPYVDYCWMYYDTPEDCLKPTVAKKQPVKNTGRRDKVLVRKY